jgi:putative ABC transport system permease protein
MVSVGWCNLKKDRLRVAVAVLGIVFSVVLVTVETGLLLGLMRNASLLVDTSRADLWISTIDVKTFDFATPFPQRKKYRIKAVEGVERVEEYFVSYSSWKLPSGGDINIQVVGFETRGELAPSIQLVEGSIEDLDQPDAVVIDELDRKKLGNPNVGDTVEILKQRARVVGFTRDMRSFTTTPYIFTALKNATKYSPFVDKRETSVYLLARVAAGSDVETVRQKVMASVDDVEAHTASSFAWRTRRYWLIETGMGIGFLGAALLGLLVGGVIVSQTLYAMTVEKLPEFGVLKALGASMPEISTIVLHQALICGGIGLVVGLAISYAISSAATNAGTLVEFSFGQVVVVCLITAGLSAAASLVSIVRLWRVDPVMVFRA